MSSEQTYHRVLGRTAKQGNTDTCSRCGHSIAEEHVPLIAWCDDGMWVYCEKCESRMLEALVPAGSTGMASS